MGMRQHKAVECRLFLVDSLPGFERPFCGDHRLLRCKTGFLIGYKSLHGMRKNHHIFIFNQIIMNMGASRSRVACHDLNKSIELSWFAGNEDPSQ